MLELYGQFNPQYLAHQFMERDPSYDIDRLLLSYVEPAHANGELS